MDQQYFIGCSGFHYKDWKGKFYPEDVPQRKWLEYYADRFDSVEINNSFYRMPKEETVKKWYERVPEHFTFTLKGSRYITHIKKLKDVSESVERFYHLSDLLKEKLGCVLWQMPPNLHLNLEKLRSFCSLLKPEYRNVIEFRHNSWYTNEVYDILREYHVGFCIISAPNDLREDAITTADFAYIRFHGKEEWYNYKYSQVEMERWSETIQRLEAKQIFIYFNNDWNANAIADGQVLRELLLHEYH